jgi:hypothetical protein
MMARPAAADPAAAAAAGCHCMQQQLSLTLPAAGAALLLLVAAAASVLLPVQPQSPEPLAALPVTLQGLVQVSWQALQQLQAMSCAVGDAAVVVVVVVLLLLLRA